MPVENVIPPTPAEDENWWDDDPTLQRFLAQYVDEATLDAARDKLETMGRLAPGKIDAWARRADANPPTLHRRSPTGERVDRVEYHPAYRNLQRAAREHGAFTLSWHPLAGHERAPRVITFALGYLYAQAEAGYYCPGCMTDGAAFVIDRHAPQEVRDLYLDGLTSQDPSKGLEGAMYLTEKKGGSDVGAGTETTAVQTEDGSWRLTGEKWFASNCTADVALALARMPDADRDEGTQGLGLFALPRRLPNGQGNPGLKIARLKDKLGVKSMATGEIVLDRAQAYLIQDAPGGFAAMAEMVNLSRLYNAVASVAIARRALREAQRAGRTRKSFGKPLREHPLFLRDLVELALDVEGALAFTLDTADAFERWAQGEETARGLVRMLTPCAKAATAKLAVHAASEGCELLGGQGYIEEYVTPRLLRDAQVLPIWEGTTNIQSLDLLRAATRENALPAFLDHARSTLEASNGHAPVEEACRLAHASLDRIEDEVQTWSKKPREEVEAATRDVLHEAYHAHAAGLLAQLAAQARTDRSDAVANLYAARHLSLERRAGHEAIREALDEHGQILAYPTRG